MTDTTESTALDESSARRERQGRLPLLAAGVLVVVAVVALAAWRATAGDDADRGPDGGPAGGAALPYDDARVTGLLTLCSADGQPVTGGSLDDRPFADVVVGETPLAAQYDPAGAVVTLFGYQPRAGIGPEEFSGTSISAPGPVVEAASPAVRIGSDAYSVRDFVTIFPADQDGLVQLRAIVGTTEDGQLTSSYDAADLRVVGDRWELVRGGDAPCADAAALVPPAR